MVTLSKREESILKELVELFIKSASPVSSLSISEIDSVGLSPASVRNTLLALEEKGFLHKPHTSAGRVPSSDGYQYYIDNLIHPTELTKDEKKAIDSALSPDQKNIMEFLDSVVRVLSELTESLGVIITPRSENLRLFRLDAIQLTENRVSLVVSTNTGLVRSVIINVGSDFDSEGLVTVCSLINERLTGLKLSEIRATIRKRLNDIRLLRESFVKAIIDSANSIFHFRVDEGLRFHGTAKLMNQPEFKGSDRLRELMSFLENSDETIEFLFNSAKEDDISINIDKPIEGIAVLRELFVLHDGQGLLCLMGPSRMDYNRAVSVLSYTGKMLNYVFR